jgi:type II secretory pathway pseudopilin PulG
MSRDRQDGLTYMTVLFVVALLSGSLALVGEAWETAARREKETELLFAGNQLRNAIVSYYERTPGNVKAYPARLEDLLNDPRQPGIQRHLRKLYPDPLGAKEWGLIAAPHGGIAGVYSLSDKAPLRTAGFGVRDAAFEGAAKYSDWKFMHTPSVQHGSFVLTKPSARPPP